jgi:hypothetical protein
MQEPRLADPLLLFDENAVHDRDLTGWSAEAQGCDLGPDEDRLAKRNTVRRYIRVCVC